MAAEENREDERRRYFRIDDRIGLRYRVVPPERLAEEVGRLLGGTPDRIAMAASFATASQQMRHAAEKVRRDQPELGSYLESLNEKVDTLIRLLAISDHDLPDHPTHQVSISGSGLAFHQPTALEEGTALELTLVLFPSLLALRAFGAVAGCQPAATGTEHLIVVDFTHIRESDRELIIRHVLQRQSILLREARIAMEEAAEKPADPTHPPR